MTYSPYNAGYGSMPGRAAGGPGTGVNAQRDAIAQALMQVANPPPGGMNPTLPGMPGPVGSLSQPSMIGSAGGQPPAASGVAGPSAAMTPAMPGAAPGMPAPAPGPANLQLPGMQLPGMAPTRVG